MKTVDFSEKIVACDLIVGRCRQLIESMKEYGYSRSKVISCPWPKVIYT